MAARLSLSPSQPHTRLNSLCRLGPNSCSRSSFVAMSANNYHFSVDLHIRSSSLKNKVFEDRMAGIVCYRDENEEITCEGYDEGPRFHHQISRFGCSNSPSRAAGIIEILERCWLQAVVDENE